MTDDRTMTDTTASSLLLDLGSAFGLQRSYTDYWGKTRSLQEPALRHFLRAIGHDDQREDALRDALAQHHGASGLDDLKPACVRRRIGPPALDLSRCGPAASTWQLQLEQGGFQAGPVHEGCIHWSAWPPEGYHQLTVHAADGAPILQTQLILCPERTFVPPALDQGERWWGPTVQLYALRSERNWGMGDFGDLKQLIDLAAEQGAAFVGLSPLHGLFPHDPLRASPYSPSHRATLNTLYIDVEHVPEYAACAAATQLVRSAAFQRQLHMLRELPHIDYAGVASAKQRVLRMLYGHFRHHHLEAGTPRGKAFESFLARGGRPLWLQARFDTLQALAHGRDPHAWGWLQWPPEWQDADGPAARAETDAHRIEVEWHLYLQWLADTQLAEAARHARQRGMPLGLYLDVAVGVNEGGAETWGDPRLFAMGVHIGAPPEEYNPAGQDWGLPPMIPQALRERGYGPFIEMLRAVMRHAGALRLDHVMALARLFWVPPDQGAAHGTYMSYPLDALLGLLALESHRHRCLVVGEDLGTVPEGFRERLGSAGVLSYCPLYFERRPDGQFRSPGEWQPQALAVVGTHDLPTLRAWWRGDDIDTRDRLGLYPSDEQRRHQVLGRAHERVALLLLLEAEGLWPAGASAHPGGVDDADPRFTEAVCTLVARSRAMLAGVQLEDITQQLEQVNVPSTTEAQHPNWRVKLPLTLEELRRDPRWRGAAHAMRSARPRADAPARQLDSLPPLSTAAVPRATYRIQFHAGMRFVDAAAAVPYLAELGIGHLYASPYLKARSGSTHGYDIIDHQALNPEIGDAQDHATLCEALAQNGLGQLLDIVPNHMGVLEADNRWWLDVLECGPASVHARTFDIEWHPPEPELRGRVLLPVLGDHYGRVLEAGELKLAFDPDSGEFAVHYHAHRFPIDPRDYPAILGAAAPVPGDDSARILLAVQSLLDALGQLPDRNTADEGDRARRQRDKVLLKQQLAELHRSHEWIRLWVHGAVQQLNGQPGNASSLDGLDALLRRQAYRLAFWRVAGDDVNYRRFFDVSTLAAVRMEDESVFELTHQTVMQWVDEGLVQGLRIDHPDGLSDPQAYFVQLQSRHVAMQVARDVQPRALYIAVEKILAEHERIPPDWPVHGGTGYRFANLVNGLFVDASQEAEMNAAYAGFVRQIPDFDRILQDAKRLIMSTSLASDLQILTEALHRVAAMDRRTCDFTRKRLREALTEVAVGHPVYRTYIGEQGVSTVDERHVNWACAEARRHSPASEVSAIDFIQDVLLHAAEEDNEARRKAMYAFIRRWQQFTAPVMAKAMEDTAFYRYHRLLSLNEVGGDPRRYGVSVAAFHAANLMRLRHTPHAMVATSTHDSKRSEDVRARLSVLSEMPQAWAAALTRWQALNKPLTERMDIVVEPEDEYLFYQTLVGIWPLTPPDQSELEALRERIQSYMLKAVREAKLHTSWINPDLAYEAHLARFIERLLSTLDPNPFLTDLQSFIEPVARQGVANGLNQVLLKFTVPGVPDLYQGCECWQFNLVDPDNRRPVDFAAMAHLLSSVQAAYVHGALEEHVALQWLRHPADSHIKMAATWRLLSLRQRHPRLFELGDYRPLAAEGPGADALVAFMRHLPGDGVCVVLSSRMGLRTGGSPWADGDTLRWPVLAEQASHDADPTWYDVLTGRELPVMRSLESDASCWQLRIADALAWWPLAVVVPSWVQATLKAHEAGA